MKKYEINQECLINQNNPTPSKHYVIIAVNIEPVKKDNGVFENFVLMMDDIQQCYENYGVIHNIQSEYFNKPVFVENITLYQHGEYTYERLRELAKANPLVDYYKKTEYYEYDVEGKAEKFKGDFFTKELDYTGVFDAEQIVIAEIKLKGLEKPLLAGFFNIHNGYYAHNVYYSNEELKVDVTEKERI